MGQTPRAPCPGYQRPGQSPGTTPHPPTAGPPATPLPAGHPSTPGSVLACPSGLLSHPPVGTGTLLLTNKVTGYRSKIGEFHQAEPATAGTRLAPGPTCSGHFVTPPVTSWRRAQRKHQTEGKGSGRLRPDRAKPGARRARRAVGTSTTLPPSPIAANRRPHRTGQGHQHRCHSNPTSP